ncbi:branched-chain amino acid ABC transporter permease [Pseudomonas alkylphenolica]|uniref:Branched-chain amino acid ABC transporter permease n=1 Tax=Pseudomonas alkylphenolica TaxID=237609 RepID=A0A443ZQH6_9PSED|nr:branched-chain amino acid ABC transporter permease [Pseudomonas alkylphenolica]MBH3426195.1 branched-chain amino acid ABC transporter permease [Pseudomonas alkylphenolica]RWU21341.1 branched-chain amino acid ABC transporter permease [Pseudomonas alkylphenolica]
MSSDILILAMLDGISYAGLLFLVALGLTFIFGVVKILNVAHGSLYAFGGYGAASLGLWWGQGSDSALVSVALLISGAIAMGVVLGTVLMLLLKKFQDRDPILQLLVTFGAFMIFEDLQRMIWGTQPYFVADVVNQLGTSELMGVVYMNYQLLFVPGAALAVYFLLKWFLNSTLAGRQIVAVTHDREVATALGINARRIGYLTFVVGAVLGSLGGALASPTTSLVPGIGADMIVLSFAVVASAGLGQITGALITALLIGLSRSFCVYLAPEFEVVMPYLIMVLVLLIRPQGLFTVVQARKI